MESEQISFDALPCFNTVPAATCGRCICKQCLYYASGRCPHGACYDSLRAKVYPRSTEQVNWCKGGVFYQSHHCNEFVQFSGCRVVECLQAVVIKYQDNHIQCPLVDTVGCEECMTSWQRQQDIDDEED